MIRPLANMFKRRKFTSLPIEVKSLIIDYITNEDDLSNVSIASPRDKHLIDRRVHDRIAVYDYFDREVPYHVKTHFTREIVDGGCRPRIESSIMNLAYHIRDSYNNSNKVGNLVNFINENKQYLDKVVYLQMIIECPVEEENLYTVFDNLLTNVHNLTFRGEPFKKFPQMGELPCLTVLNLNQCKLTTTSELPEAPNLQRLDLSFNALEDVSNLTKYKKLEYLSLESNKHLTELPHVNELIQLRELDIRRTKCGDHVLQNGLELPQLEKLILRSSELTMIRGLNLPNLLELDISDCQLGRIENLEHLVRLEKLTISDCAVDSIRGLDKLVNLIELNLSYNWLKKVGNLQMNTQLQRLDLTGCKIEVVEDLHSLINLEVLSLNSNRITEFQTTPLVKLKELKLSGNCFTEISDLENMPNLTYLDLSGNRINEIENLDKLNNLHYLNLDHTSIGSIPKINKNLIELRLSHTNITEISNLEQAEDLQILCLSGTMINEITGLTHCKSLQRLHLDDTQVTKIKGLDNCKELLGVTFKNSPIEKIEGLGQLQKLSFLEIGGSKIETIENLDCLNLQILKLNHLNLGKIENLNKLTKLTKLDLGHCELIVISGLDELTQLQELSLRRNKIQEITGLDKLVNLKSLDLCGNQISQMTNISHLQELVTLKLSSNLLTRINFINLPNLQILEMNNNKINEIENLSNYKKLTHLNLDNNLITRVDNLHGVGNFCNIKLKNNKYLNSINETNWSFISKIDSIHLDKFGYFCWLKELKFEKRLVELLGKGIDIK